METLDGFFRWATAIGDIAVACNIAHPALRKVFRISDITGDLHGTQVVSDTVTAFSVDACNAIPPFNHSC